MKWLTIICFAAVLAFDAHAQDVSGKSFSDLTLAELESIEADTLTKAERKLFKKALRAAKKAEKARLKAERERKRAEEKARKRAEKARIKAEKKRKKELLKAQKARYDAAKQALHQLRFAHHNTTKIYDEFDHLYYIEGPQLVDPADPRYGYTRYWLASTIDPKTQEFSITLYFSELRWVTEIDINNVQELDITPSTWVTQNNRWLDYNEAKLSTGTARPVSTVKRAFIHCDIVSCKFRETYRVHVTIDDILHYMGEHKPMRMRISGPRLYTIEEVSPYYTLGFFKRLAELFPELDKIMPAILLVEEQLNETIQELAPADD